MQSPVNEIKYIREEIPTNNQAVFTSKLSSAGQGIVPATIRSGKDTAPQFKILTGCKVELQIKAVYYKVRTCPKCGGDIIMDGQPYNHKCKE